MNASERQAVERAIQLLQRAVSHDRRGARALALAHYCRGIDLLLPLLRSPRCSVRHREVIQQKCQQYLDRARLLRTAIREHGPAGELDIHMDDAEEEEDEVAGAGAIPELGGENRDDARGHEGRGVVGVEEGNREEVHVEGAGEGEGGGNEATVTNARCILKELESNYDRDRRRLQWHLNACVRRENLGNVHPTLMGSSQDLRAVEDRLKELVLLPLRFPHLFQARMLHGRRTLLLYGHKGTGKTQMMREFLAADICCELLCVSAANLLFTAVACGVDGRKLMRGLIERARESVPCVLCVEDIELLGSSRALTEAVGRVRGLGDEDDVKIHEPLFVTSRNMKTELLVSMDEIQRCEKPVILTATTSRPWMLDASRLRRRFVVRCFFPMPAAEERVAILMRGLEGVPHQLNHEDLREIGNMTVRFSRDDMAVLADEAQGQMKVRVQRATHFKPVHIASDDPSPVDSVDEVKAGPVDRLRDPNGASAGNSRDADSDSDSAFETEADSGRGACAQEDNEDVELVYEVENRNCCAGLVETSRDATAESVGRSHNCSFESAGCADPGASGSNSGDASSASLHLDTDDLDGDQCRRGRRPFTFASKPRRDVTTRYTPCDATDDDAILMTWRDCGGDSLLEPPVAFCDVVEALSYMSAQITDEDVGRMIQWNEDFGPLA